MKPKYIALAGGIAMIIGSVLPWATVNTFLGSLSINGTDGDGILSLACGIAVVLAALVAKERAGANGSILAALFGIGGGFFAVNAMINVGGAIRGEDFGGLASASIGIGVYVVIVGVILAIVGGLMRNPATATLMTPPTSPQP